MNLAAEAIKLKLSTRMVAERYGLNPDRSGFISCPFHADKTPSLKVYDQPGHGFFCYGCGAGGSVIDFVMRLFQIRFSQAILRLNMDFQLNAIGQIAGYREIRKFQQHREQIRQRESAKKARTLELCMEHCQFWQIARFGRIWSDEWCDAIDKISDIECLLEVEHDGIYQRAIPGYPGSL